MDDRLKWIETHVSSSLRPRNEDLKAMLASDENRLAFHEFIRNEDTKCLFVFVRPNSRKIVASLHPPNGFTSKSIFFTKSQGVKLTRDNIGDEVSYVDSDSSVLNQIDLVLREVYLPLLCSEENAFKSTAGAGTDKLMDLLHRLISSAEVTSGYVEGRVTLPLPSVEVLAEATSSPSRRPAVLHVLESTVVGWMKQIRGLLKHDPTSDLKRKYGARPGPLDELALWQKRQQMLISIEQQLFSPVAKDIIMNLEEAQSTYASSFQTVRTEISKSLKDAEDILQFWDAMKKWFIQLHQSSEAVVILRLLPPIVHTLLLVWQYSRYYHRPENFATLLCVVCNEIVIRAVAVIGQDVLKDPLQSHSKIKEALKVCAAFRGTYLDYRDKANQINSENVKDNAEKMTLAPQGELWTTKLYGPYAYHPKYGVRASDQISSSQESLLVRQELYEDSPWPPRNAPCFDYLNAFMERCNDVLELVQTTRHFRTLSAAASVGGAGSLSLDALVREIDAKYKRATAEFFGLVGNVLDIDDTQAFEKAFFSFRSVVKALEMQLANVIRQCFSQCPTISAQLRLLEVFEGISSRDQVQASLKDKDELLIRSFTAEIIQVKTMFEYMMKRPPLHKNMPSLVSKIMWVRALRQRITEPMEKMKSVSPHSLDGDRGWHVREVFAETVAELDKYESRISSEWQSRVDAELVEKLKQPVLVAEDYDEETELRPQVIHVNLDPKLLLLMREVQYIGSDMTGSAAAIDGVSMAINAEAPIKMIAIQPPSAAREVVRIARPGELRGLATRLATVVSKYNAIMKMMGDYERPLLERKLARIDQLLEKGLTQLTWKSAEISDFIESATQLVCLDVHVNLDLVQSNCREIASMSLSWCKGVLDVFMARDPRTSYSIDELATMHRTLESSVESIIVPAGNRIHVLVQDSFKAIGISQASPAWGNYVEFIDAIVLNGLKQTTLSSLKTMLRQMGDEAVAKEVVPLLTIRIELIQGTVTFQPPLEEDTSVTAAQEVISGWLQAYLDRGKMVKMLGPKNSYQDYIASDEEVRAIVDEIKEIVVHNSEECKQLLSLFTEYSFLWEQDVQETFHEFLKGTVSPNPRRSTTLMEQGPGQMRRIASGRSSATSRSSSARSIESVGIVGTAEKSFLAPSKKPEDDSAVPSLDEFDVEIEIYRTAREEASDLQDYCDLGWIRVDLKPIKQVLITYASKWMWTFTNYLAEQVTKMLNALDQFLRRIEPEIESIRGNERDTSSFMKMMRLFNEVSAQQQEMDGKFAAMHRTVLLLKKYDQTLPDATQQLFSAAPGRWNSLKTKVSLAKQRLGPRIQEESERISKDLAAFGRRVKSLQSELAASDIYSRECSMSAAWDILDRFSKRLTELENEAQDLAELQELLEADIVNFAILPSCRLNIDNLKQVWETARVLNEEHNEWKSHRWHKIVTRHLRQETERQQDGVRRLPDEAQGWDVYMGMLERISTVQSCLPIIDDLSNPAMRTRHWKQLVRVTGGAIQIDNDTLKRMTLGDLLSLGLQKHVDDVRAIVQRAVKDLAIEKSLKTYEEVWLSKVFELRLHIRTKIMQEQAEVNIPDNQSEISHAESHVSHRPGGRSQSRVSVSQSSVSRFRRSSTSSLPQSLVNLGEDSGQIYLLTKTEPIFEELESHQVALQSMQGNSAAGSFLDEVLKWQKRLQTIEAVLSAWLEAQEKWIELEEVYTSSEVRASLPKVVRLFEDANKDFRLLMRATEKNPNVLQCCSRKNILSILEKMNMALGKCRQTLLHHLGRRLTKFPRFYFLSTEDVLHIICNGYDLNQVNIYISKLFENIGALTFVEPENTPKGLFEITGVKSLMFEHLKFKETFNSDGAIEVWLATLLSSISTSLQQQLRMVMAMEKPPEITLKAKRREIRSAGSRRVVVQSSSRRISPHPRGGLHERPSRAGSRRDEKGRLSQTRRTTTHRDNAASSSAAAGNNDEGAAEEDDDEEKSGSWTLDNSCQIVYLVTQLLMTKQIEEAFAASAAGDTNAFANNQRKINDSIREAVMMLKGLETKQEQEEMERYERSKAESRADGQDKSESGSAGGGGSQLDRKSARGGSKTGSHAGSHRGSIYDITKENPQTPIPEEENGSTQEALHHGEPLAPEPVNTMDLGAASFIAVNNELEEDVAIEIERAELRLMLFPNQIHKITCLVALLAYYRDLLQRIQYQLSQGKLSSDAFLWKSQLRYDMANESGAVTVKCLDASFEYDFEYLGSSRREVVSPVSERVFVNLTTSISDYMGAMVVGHAGSGRRETVHELSRALGKSYYSFNCHRNYSSATLHGVFKGLALTGSWICFNNIDHLSRPVLASFAQLMTSVLEAMREGRATCMLASEELHVNPKGACLVVLDGSLRVRDSDPDRYLALPSALSALPQDLLQLFRPVCILKPDLRLTVEALLLGQGFADASSLSRKISAMYDLSSNLAGTTQQFTDEPVLGGHFSRGGWSIHTLKFVVAEAGALLDKLSASRGQAAAKTKDADVDEDKVAETGAADDAATSGAVATGDNKEVKTKESAADNEPTNGSGSEAVLEQFATDEETAVVTALRDTFVPRLKESDAKVFTTLLADLFPAADVPLLLATSSSATDVQSSEQQQHQQPLPQLRSPSNLEVSMKTSRVPSFRGTSRSSAASKPKSSRQASRRGVRAAGPSGVKGIQESLQLNTPVANLAVDYSGHNFDSILDMDREPLTELEDAIAVATAELGLMPGCSFQARVTQLSHLSATHRSIIVVGPAGCGKSECIKTFAVAERERGKTVSVQSLFTKAFDASDFLGHYDAKEREWKDGLLPHILRKLCMNNSILNGTESGAISLRSPMKILLLDGECDPVQMEIMHSVLHNDGFIVLGNNERLEVADNVRCIWETDSVAHMDPSVLANVGLLVMSGSDLGWKILLAHWLQSRPAAVKTLLSTLAELYLPPVIDYLSACTSSPVLISSSTAGKSTPASYTRCIRHSDENMVMTFTNLLENFIRSFGEDPVPDIALERYFVFSAIWAFAGTLDHQYREHFSNWWRSKFSDRLEWPLAGTIFDFTIDPESNEFARWNTVVPAYSSTPFQGIPADAYVHTVTNEQLMFLLSQLSDSGKPVMFVGESGSGKSAIIKERIRNVSTGEVAEVLALCISANRFTSSNLMYQRLNEKLEWKHGRTYVPKGSKRLICLVDDLNLAQVDQFGHQTAVELIRQHIDEGGFYSPENFSWRYVRNVAYVSTMNPRPNVAIPKISQRVLRHFALFGCPYPSNKELETVFRTLLQTHFITPEMTSAVTISASAAQHLGIKDEKVKTVIRQDEESLKRLLSLIVSVTVQLQERLREMFVPTAKRCHYLFTMRDLGVVFRNITLSLGTGCHSDALLRLWQHECDWVYGARLTSSLDRARYEKAFKTAVRKDFVDEDQIKMLIADDKPMFSSLVEQDSGAVTAGTMSSADSASSIGQMGQSALAVDLYSTEWDVHKLRRLLDRGIEEYNKIHPRIKLTLHKSVIQHICRMARTISSPHEVAHSHLISEGCPGRSTTIVRLAAHLCGFQIVHIGGHVAGIESDISHNERMQQFKSDIVEAYKSAGVKGEKILLLLEEEQLLEEDYLVYIIEFIASGAIAHLFTHEEFTTIVNSIRTEVTQAGLTYTRDVAWNFFLRAVKKNFRMCFISSNGSTVFQQRCREYPSLLTNINFIWMQHWSRTTLVEHASYYVQGVSWMTNIQRENVAHMLASMHLVIRQTDGNEETCGEYEHLTNTTFEKFVECFVAVANRRQDDIVATHEATKKALEQIYKENEISTKLQKQLEHEKIVLEERIAGTAKILAQIGQDTAITEQQVKVVRQQMDKIRRLKKLLPEYQVAHERAVFKASAIVIDTKKIVQNIDSDSLQELRGMQKPILEVEDLMAAIIMILKSPSADLTWQKGAKRQMANLERFLEELAAFDEQQMPESTLLLVEPYLKKPSFDPEALERKANNAACGSLCRWVHGVVRYHRMMISKVKPLHDKVATTTQAVDDAEHKMTSLESKRQALEVRLNDLAKGFEDATIDKNDQYDKTVKMDVMLTTAAQLRQALESEHARCEQVFSMLKARLSYVSGAVAMAAAFATYLGPYSHTFRRLMLTVKWPHCLRERGVPLVFDTVDSLRGCIVDFAMDDVGGVPSAYSASVGTPRNWSGSNSVAAPDWAAPAATETQIVPAIGSKDVPIADQQNASSNGPSLGNGNREEPLQAGAAADSEAQGVAEDRGDAASAAGNAKAPSSLADSYGTASRPLTVTPELYRAYIDSIIKLLVGESLQQRWIRKDYTVHQRENAAIIALPNQRPPLLLDPYGEGALWLGRFYRSHARKNLHIVEDNFLDSQSTAVLENSVVSGSPVLVTGCEKRVSAALMPLIAHHNTVCCGSTAAENDPRVIHFMGRRVLCHPKFQLCLSSPLARPGFSSLLASTTAAVSFCACPESLEELLQRRAFSRVRPALYKEKLDILRSLHTLRGMLDQLKGFSQRGGAGDASKDLGTAANAPAAANAARSVGSSDVQIWSEQEVQLISYGVDKKDEVSDKLRSATEALEKIQALEEEFRPVARRGAMLFSTLRSLAVVHREYHFSLPYFRQLFDAAIGQPSPADDVGDSDDDEIDESAVAAEKLQHHANVSVAAATASSRNQQERFTPAARAPSSDPQALQAEDDGEDAMSEAVKSEGSDPLQLIRGVHPDAADDSNTLDAKHMLPFENVSEIPNYPTSGVDYGELSANRIKLYVDSLTAHVLERAQMSIFTEHKLLFLAVACLNIQKEVSPPFTDAELSLLLQGNPGLGVQLTLQDFGSSRQPPSWLPKDRWDNVMALSVLPGRMDNLCVQLVENERAWLDWYKSEEPEKVAVPFLSRSTEAERLQDDTEGASDAAAASASQSEPTDEEEPLSDFHKLLILRMLRPDRLHTALGAYVGAHLEVASAGDVDSDRPAEGAAAASQDPAAGDREQQQQIVLLDDIILAANSGYSTAAPANASTSAQPLGILILRRRAAATSAAPEQHDSGSIASLLGEAAKRRGVTLLTVKMNETAEESLTTATTFIKKKEPNCWLLLDNIHAAPERLLFLLKRRLAGLVYINAERDAGSTSRNGPLIWLTVEVGHRLPAGLLQSLLVLSGDVATASLFESGLRLSCRPPPSDLANVLGRALSDSLGALPTTLLEQVQQGAQKTPAVRDLAFRCCLLHAILAGRLAFGWLGFCQWYPLRVQQLVQCLQFVLHRSSGSSEGAGNQSPEQQQQLSIDVVAYVMEHVYGSFMCCSRDYHIVKQISSLIFQSVDSTSDVCLQTPGGTISLPPANVEFAKLSQWYMDKVSDSIVSDAAAVGLHRLAPLVIEKGRSAEFVRFLEWLSDVQHFDYATATERPSAAVNTQAALQASDVSRLNLVVSAISDKMPSLVELGDLPPVSAASAFSFPYHPPSAHSTLAADTNFMPETIGYTLLQECYRLNALICHVRQQLYDIQRCLLVGVDGLSANHLHTVRTILAEQTPLSWLHPGQLPSSHTLFSWLDDLQRRHQQMRQWNRYGFVPQPGSHDKVAERSFRGQLKSVWLGGLYNPGALLTAILHEKAVVCNASADDITFLCEQPKLELEESEGGLFVEGLHLLGATWDAETSQVVFTEAGPYISQMPTVYLRPVLKSDLLLGSADEGSQSDNVDNDERHPPPSVYYCPINTCKNGQVCVGYLPLFSTAEDAAWRMPSVAVLLDAGAHDDYPRRHQIIQHARVADIQVVPSQSASPWSPTPLQPAATARFGDEASRTDSVRRSKAGNGTAPLEPVTAGASGSATPKSQLSYKAMTPQADPLPSPLRMRREEPLIAGATDLTAKRAIAGGTPSGRTPDSPAATATTPPRDQNRRDDRTSSKGSGSGATRSRGSQEAAQAKAATAGDGSSASAAAGSAKSKKSTASKSSTAAGGSKR